MNASQTGRVFVIANPAAAKGKALRHLAPLCERLKQEGIYVQTKPTEHPRHAIALAREAAEKREPLVVAFGGDGTVREIVAGLVGSETLLGVLPYGSGNDLARSLGIPTRLEAALDVVRKGIPLAMDVGEETSGVFVTGCGVGFAAEVAYEANRSRWFSGSAAYFVGVFKALTRIRPVPMTVALDDNVVRTKGVFVMAQNTPYCGGGQLIAPEAKLNDGKLDVVIVREVGQLELIKTFPQVYSGRHVTHPAFEVHRSTSVRVESETPLRKTLDGDLFGTEPMSARIRPQAIRVLVPNPHALPPRQQTVLSGETSSQISYEGKTNP